MGWSLSAFVDEAADSCDGQIAAAKAAGLGFVDLRNIDGLNIAALPIEAAKVIRQKLDNAWLKVGMLGSPIGKIDITEDVESDLAKLRHLATLREVLGTNQVRIFSYFNKTNLPPAAARDEVFRRLDLLQCEAQDLGLVLYHENEMQIFGDKAADVLAIAQEFRDGESFKMIFDFGNFNAGKQDVWEAWETLRDMVDAIHIKDNIWGADGNLVHVPAGLGQGKIPEILADAAKRNWNGPIVVESHLQHSAGVVATGPSGVANQAYSAMTPQESFVLACNTAKEVIAAASLQGG